MSGASAHLAGIGVFASAWALTLLIEVPIWVALLERVLEVDRRRAVAVAIGVNAVSHPLLWFLLQPLLVDATGSDLLGIVAAEAVVVGFEAALAYLVVRRDPGPLVALSVLANLASVLVGIVLWFLD